MSQGSRKSETAATAARRNAWASRRCTTRQSINYLNTSKEMSKKRKWSSGCSQWSSTVRSRRVRGLKFRRTASTQASLMRMTKRMISLLVLNGLTTLRLLTREASLAWPTTWLARQCKCHPPIYTVGCFAHEIRELGSSRNTWKDMETLLWRQKITLNQTKSWDLS